MKWNHYSASFPREAGLGVRPLQRIRIPGCFLVHKQKTFYTVTTGNKKVGSHGIPGIPTFATVYREETCLLT